MREWCLVIDAWSSEDAARVGHALRDQRLDLEVDKRDARVLCFAESEATMRRLAKEIRRTLQQASLWEGVVRSGRLWVWSEQQHRYADPERPEVDAEDDETYPEPESAWDPDSDWEPNIDASAAARAYIRERGGRLYVWLDDIGGGGWATERVSTFAPEGGRQFDEFYAGDFTLCLERDFRPPMVKLRLRRWWPAAPISIRTGLEASEKGVPGGGG
jgi:hypothetical protein